MVARRRALLGLVLLGLGTFAYAHWIEPRKLLFRDWVPIRLDTPRVRIAHLSDLHIRGDMPLLHRLLDEVAAARPDLIVISGDLIRDVPDPETFRRNTAATAAFVAGLRRMAPVFAVQGHSEHRGDLVAALRRAGLEWLSNEGRLIGPDGNVLLLGLNQQVGFDRFGWRWRSPFQAVRADGHRLYGAVRPGDAYRNFYSHFDPEPAGLSDADGPLAWSGYEVACSLRVDGTETGAGLAVHSRYVLGEDRLILLRRDGSRWGSPTFRFALHGTDFTNSDARPDTGVAPEPGRWYRVRLRTEVAPGVVRAFAKVWPEGEPEPAAWQAHGEDRSPGRIESGTVGLWASGGGTVVYRDLRVVDSAGRVLLDEPLVLPKGKTAPAGFREGARGTRLELALARSPTVAPDTPVVVLSHVADVALEASTRGLDAVLAGHTHGGQVRLPVLEALTTRSALGAYYDMGRFELNSPNPRGYTSLYINSGVGMSVLPVRFLCPPRWALVEIGR